ncbi:unannotated protein [freshwater metagenome]|uniref:Unannotated protein n=1 Tax=freshwater metagenome TaxID=449393 RepID=A0A6J6B679_9ZZZZ|nr:hypothetical protein [Actinomycetota bacterium]
MNLIERYRLNRQSFQLLGRSLNQDQENCVVAATPEWTIRDVFAHMAGVADDVLSGRLEGVATDPWTAVQVEARQGNSLSELVTEWESTAPLLEELLMPMADQVDPRLVIDLWSHEQDVRGTSGTPGGDHGETLDWIVEVVVSGWTTRLERSDLDPLRIEVMASSDESSDQRAKALPTTSEGLLRIAPYEVARVAVGRRSIQQIMRYDWQGVRNPLEYVDLLVAFTPATHDIVDA